MAASLFWIEALCGKDGIDKFSEFNRRPIQDQIECLVHRTEAERCAEIVPKALSRFLAKTDLQKYLAEMWA
jgi:hypothetical protein